MASLALGMGLSAAGSLFGGLFGGNASQQASQEYIQALQQAQGYLKDSENQGQQLYSPYTQAGQQAPGPLSSLLPSPGQGLPPPWTQQFTAPTAAQAAATPGYQFQQQQGQAAMQKDRKSTRLNSSH